MGWGRVLPCRGVAWRGALGRAVPSCAVQRWLVEAWLEKNKVRSEGIAGTGKEDSRTILTQN